MEAAMTFSNEEKRNYLKELNAQAELGGGEARVKRQHDQGKYNSYKIRILYKLGLPS